MFKTLNVMFNKHVYLKLLQQFLSNEFVEMRYIQLFYIFYNCTFCARHL